MSKLTNMHAGSPEGAGSDGDREVASFSSTFRSAAGHAGSMAVTVAITMLQLAFFYLVPLFLLLAFGRHPSGILIVMAASSFVQLLSSAVPLSGGTGGAGAVSPCFSAVSSVRQRRQPI